MLFPAPAQPAFAPGHTVTAEFYPRYEDAIQDGRLTTLAIPPALATMWNARDLDQPVTRAIRAAGVIPLLTRLTVTSLEQPVRVSRPFQADTGFEVAHDRDDQGAPSKLFLTMWAELRGRPHLSPDARTAGAAGGRVLAGQAFAEHTYTRPFGPPEQRRVTSFAGIPGAPELPEARYHQPAPASAADAPAGARWLDELAADSVETTFTLDHTDANQHVNSLVYVRLYLDAAQRRLVAAGQPPRLHARAFDIAYRKPSFPGERVRAHIRLFAIGDLVGGAGFIAAPGEDTRPRCYVRALYGP